jgi:uncharacterized repeat protein (TIGR01451 family)
MLAVEAKPAVELRLQGVLVEREASGAEKTTPVADAALKPGETVRYTIVATNRGTDPALGLRPVGKIPAGTAYEAGSAAGTSAARIEFSLDGGKTWSVSPKVKVKTADGIVEKDADPQTFTTIRWIVVKPLDPKSSYTYTYQVRVK